MIKAAFTTLAVTFGLALAFYWRFTQRRLKWESAARQRGAGTPKQASFKDPFLAMDYGAAIRSDLPYNLRLHARHGKTFAVTPMFGAPQIVTTDTENLPVLFGGRNDDWGIEPHRLPPSVQLLGHGFLTCDGDVWAKSRRMVKPSFNTENINDFSVLKAQVDEMIAKLPKDGATVDMDPLLHLLFLNNSMNFIVGVDLSAEDPTAPHKREAFLSAFDDALFGVGLQLILGPLAAVVPLPSYARGCKTAQAFVDHYIGRAVHEAQNMRNGELTQGSIIHGLTSHTGDRDLVRDNVLQAFLAAQDTTSSLVGSALFLLSRHQRYWAAVRAEAREGGDKYFSYDGVTNSPLLRSILLETLRVHPVFPHQVREALRDTTLPRGGGADGTLPVFVPKGTVAIAELYSLHQDAAVFGSDAADFRPERWRGIDPSQWEFMAFGGGKRACLGRPKALAEAAYIVARLATEFEKVESRDDRPWTLEYKVTSRNKHGCRVTFRK